MAKSISTLVFGEILWDIIENQKYIGGAPLNFAAHIVKCGGTSSVISGVGNDELGRLALEYVDKLNVDASAVFIHPDKPTSTVEVFLQQGQPDYTIHENVAFDFIPKDVISKIPNTVVDVFYFGTLAQRHEVSRSTLHAILEQRKFNHVFYDINIRKEFYTPEIIRYGLNHCSIFKINDAEVNLISALFYSEILSFEEFVKRISTEFNVDTIVITAGDKGCYVWSGKTFTYVPGVVVKVADTVGAGDAFSAAFMYQLGRGKSAVDAAAFGNQVGAFVASSKGPIPEYSNAIKKVLATH
ncbi:MAG TPA: carbohydrate kinase [Cyclobacteriaceae bacterium]